MFFIVPNCCADKLVTIRYVLNVPLTAEASPQLSPVPLAVPVRSSGTAGPHGSSSVQTEHPRYCVVLRMRGMIFVYVFGMPRIFSELRMQIYTVPL